MFFSQINLHSCFGVCRADIRHQKWYCNQSWGNGSDAVLSPSSDPAESTPLADVWVRDEPFYLFVDHFFGQSTNLRTFFLFFLTKYRFCCLQHYRPHSLFGLSSFCTFWHFLFLDKSQNQALKVVVLRVHVTDGKTQFLRWVSSHRLVDPVNKWLIKVRTQIHPNRWVDFVQSC